MAAVHSASQWLRAAVQRWSDLLLVRFPDLPYARNSRFRQNIFALEAAEDTPGLSPAQEVRPALRPRVSS